MTRKVLPILVLACAATSAAAQVNPVYVDDSPRAWELYRRAQDQRQDNLGESVRLLQELLEDYGMKLIPVSEAGPDHLVAVRQRVLRDLRSDEALLERYRTIATAEAQRLLNAGDMRTLALTRSVTRPGLEALLCLGQRELESAHFRTALDWLDEALVHPDLTGREAVHAWLMTGIAAHYLGDDDRYRDAMQKLDRLDGTEAARAELAGLDPVEAERLDGITVLDRGAASDLQDLVAQEIWSVELSDSLLNRRFRETVEDATPRHPAFERRRVEADLATVAATVAGPDLFVNQGHSILSINRLTGRVNWTYADRPLPAVVDRDNDQMTDLNIVAAADGVIVTLTGHAFPMGRSSQGRIVCLDAESGDVRWTQDVDAIGGFVEHEDLFAHGAPLVAEGRVYLLARKVSRQLLTSCYVVALDLQDGRYLWSHHVASSGGVRRSGRPFSSLAYDNGSLYVASAVGGIARLNASTGECVWLQRFNVPINPSSQDQDRRPWEMSSPVVTSRGVVALEPGQRRIVVLDAETGDMLESHSARARDGWAGPAYLLANDHSVYAIGREIRAFRTDDFDRPIWRLPAEEPAQGVPPSRLAIRGRVQLVEGLLVVPTLSGVKLVDDETGNIIHEVATKTIGNPLAVGSQLLLAGGDRLDAYMSFGRAENLLRERIAMSPSDPEPALSLLRLARRARNLELALEAADLVVDALERADANGDSRAELFAMLLAIGDERVFESNDEGEQLYAIIGDVASTPDQRVQFHLSYGDWLVDREFSRAIEAYQAILSDPTMGGSWRAEAGSVRTARAWSIERLEGLIRRHGRGVYAPQADFAAIRLDMSRGQAGVDPDVLLAVAAEFPFAPAATDAVLEAAELLRSRGDYRAALAALTGTIRTAANPPGLPNLLGRAVAICLEAGHDAQAATLLRWGIDHDPQMTFAGVAGPRRADEWLETVEQHRSVRPALGDQSGDGKLLEARVVPPHPMAGRVGSEAALLTTGAELRYVDASDLSMRWSVPFDGDSPQVLQLGDGQVLLWSGENVGDPWAIMLDAANGAERWVTPSLFEILPQRRPGEREEQDHRMPNGQPFDAAEVIPLPGRSTLIAVQRSGGVVAFDLDDAGIAWKQDRTLEQIHHAARHDYGVVLVGMDREVHGPAAGALVPRIVVLDVVTGDPIHTARPRGRAAVNWMAIDPLGALVLGSTEALELIDLLGGDQILANITYAAMDTQAGWPLDHHVLIKDRPLALRSMRLGDGALSEPFEAPLRGDWDPLDLREVLVTDHGTFARYKQRIVQFGADGTTLGADIIMDDRDYKWLVASRDRLLVVSGRTEQALVPDRAGRRTQYLYRVYTLSDNCMLIGEPLDLPPSRQRVDEMVAIDGWLLMSRSSTTVAVPFPVSSAP